MSEDGQDIDISTEERAEIDGMFLRLANANYYELLGVGADADRKTIREAYFLLSQRFHPDVWFGRKTGAWKPRMEMIFREVTKAYDVLSNRNHRATYDASLGMSVRAPGAATNLAARPTPAAQGMPYTATNAAPTAEKSTDSSPPRTSSGSYRAQTPPTAPGTSSPPYPTTGAHRTAAPIPTPALPHDPNAPIIPQRDARVAPPSFTTNPGTPRPTVDVEAARRAARENLARKMGSASGPNITTGRFPRQGGSGSMPAVTPPADPPPPSSTMASMQHARVQRIDAERAAKLQHYLQLAEDSQKRHDVLGVSNALQLAVAISPDDVDLKLRADEAAGRSADIMAERYIEQARQCEAQQRWDAAADFWQRAAAGRPRDVGVLVRAATAIHRTGNDAQKAADLAKRAVQLVPRIETYALLVDIYLSARMKASAHAAAEAAAKLDPASPVVKDLLAKAKG